MGPHVSHVFTMAPVPGEEEFTPASAIEKRAPQASMNLAGNWDLIGKTRIAKDITKRCNTQIPGSSMYVEINRGVHTGFEDELVLFNVDLGRAASMALKVLNISNFATVLALKIVGFVRGRTGQIEITRTFLSYFMTKMVNDDENLSDVEALEVLKNDPDIKEKWVKKVEIS